MECFNIKFLFKIKPERCTESAYVDECESFIKRTTSVESLSNFFEIRVDEINDNESDCDCESNCESEGDCCSESNCESDCSSEKGSDCESVSGEYLLIPIPMNN